MKAIDPTDPNPESGPGFASITDPDPNPHSVVAAAPTTLTEISDLLSDIPDVDEQESNTNTLTDDEHALKYIRIV